MTLLATKVNPVVTWIITIRIMTERGRRPAIGVMADVTLFSCRQVAIRLAGRAATVVIVAAVAVTCGAGIMHPGAAYEGRRGVAKMAIQRGCYMRRNGISFAFRRVTVVTGLAVIHDTGVIKHGTDKGNGVMTNATVLVGRHMVWRGYLARRRTAVMAGRTVVHDAGVIEIRTAKGTGVMTGRTVLVGTNRNVTHGHAS